MKRTERRHLKQNELVTTVSRARGLYATYHRQITGGGIALVLLVAAVAAVGAWQQYTRTTSIRLLAEALQRYHGSSATSTPAGVSLPDRATLEQSLPRFARVAQAYRSQPAGLRARYYEGVTLAGLGRTDEARKAFEDVKARDRDTLFGALSKMALAELDAQQGKTARAVEQFKQMAADPKSPIPEDAVLIRLARAYQQTGDTANAERTYRRLADEFSFSPYLSDAQRELDLLKPGHTAKPITP